MTMTPFVVAAGVAAMLVAGNAQTSAPMRLGASDYVAIETAYSRALHDRGALDGIRYWLTNLAIEPSRDGAAAWAYVVEGRGLEFSNPALYQDQWVRTGRAWRLGRRAVHAGNAMPPREHLVPPSNVGGRAFTPRDYFEIKHIVWRYNLGYDSAAQYDGGVLSSLSFTRDAFFERLGSGDSRGRDELVAYAKERQKSGGTHHWDTSVLLDITPEGVDGFSYLTTFGVSDAGGPVRVSPGRGPLVHRFSRTPEGWLISYRGYKPVALKPDVSWPPAEFGLSSSDIDRDANAEAQGRGQQMGAIDFINIEQLYARAAIAFDSVSGDGRAFAQSFTRDGVFTRNGVTTTGTAALAALASGQKPRVETWLSNLYLAPARYGARGRVYVHVKGGTSPVTEAGTFEDEVVRTADGWRFRRRVYSPAQ